jgi:hypothetical protein
MEQMYAAFNAWKDKYQDNIVDMGGRLTGESKIVTAKSLIIGPFVEPKEIIGGYIIVQADSYEQAVEIAQQSPGVAMPGSSVEIKLINTP